jgi:hypothetical protein
MNRGNRGVGWSGRNMPGRARADGLAAGANASDALEFAESERIVRLIGNRRPMIAELLETVGVPSYIVKATGERNAPLSFIPGET